MIVIKKFLSPEICIVKYWIVIFVKWNDRLYYRAPNIFND